MKPTLIQRLKASLLVSGHKKQQGVAILTVLAIITLMTVLVISFFNMAQTAQTTAKGSVEIQRVTTLKDTIINLVIAQVREASRLTPSSGTDPRNIITWTSQPGAIRTYSGRELAKNRLYKLYSSKVPQIGDISPGETPKLLNSINDDIVPDWAERPDEFTDLNRPVYTAATGDKARATGASDKEGYSYPIVDPRAYNGKSDPLVNVEGFEFSQNSLTKRVRGVDAIDGQLAMPLRWIYQLQDGTLGYLNDSKEFTSLNGKDGGEVSRLNPIVGRMAWWADDESCKVNVNTASIPAIWDTPRTTSLEDVWLAKTQPLAGEYQRYPGHPSTVDLSAVLFPGRRYASTDGSFEMPVGKSMSGRLKEDEANLIWDLAPFIVGNTSSGETGTLGGTKITPISGTTVNFEGDDHLFTSLDEVYFKASGATNKSLNSPRENLESQGKDARGELLQRLERAQFFLTHKSHSPELTNQGFPRVSMFPMDTNAAQYVKTVMSNTTATTVAAPPTGVSPYDVTMAINSTIGNRPYYFQRRDPTSRHNEFYSTSGALDPQRDINLMRYLKELSRLPIPGYPPGYPGAEAFQLSTYPEDAAGLSLASKYPPGFNPVTSTRFADNNYNKQNGYTLQDASDRTQILLNMLDFTRSINMQPAFLQTTDKYDKGNGQSTSLCGCGEAGNHNSNISYNNNFTHRCPKGAGKLMAPSEIAMVVNVAAKKKGEDTGSTEWNTLKNLMLPNTPSRMLADNDKESGTRYIVEVGFVMGGFNPKMGWAPTMPGGGISISTTTDGTPQSPVGSATNQTNVLPLYMNVDGGGQEYLRIASIRNASSGGTTAAASNGMRPNPTNLIPYGGMIGPRGSMGNLGEDTAGNNFAICAPICIRVQGEADGGVPITLSANTLSAIRIMIMDGAAADHNVTSVVDLRLPSDFAGEMQIPYTGYSLRTQAKNFSKSPLQYPFPNKESVVRSFVIPHGDYRLATSLRMDNDLYVAHVDYKKPQSHSLYESNENPAKRQMYGATYNSLTIIDKTKVPLYIAPGGGPMSSLPLPLSDKKDLKQKDENLMVGPVNNSKIIPIPPDQDIKTYASGTGNLMRQEIFSFGRRDGRGQVAKRGSSDPDETGDFDTGVGAGEDGPYMNYPDEGDRRKNTGAIPYFTKLTEVLKTSDGKPAQNISPNLLVRSPVDFGSIPSGLQARVPWQTLRFRPDPGMNDPDKVMKNVKQDKPPGRLPFANFCGPRDHFFLDMFWMPVVEPYSISEPFSTKGTINLNQQIFPFLYIQRTTALHALLRGERMLAIPNEAAAMYKRVNSDGSPNNDDLTYRYWLNVGETVKQFTQRYMEGTDPEGFPLAFNTFRSASEICEVWLVPDKNDGKYEEANTWDLAWTIGKTDQFNRDGFWSEHRITGDNARERPYSNLYPRVTVRSNVFKLHMVAQTLQKARSTDPKNFDSVVDAVTAEWRGSCLIERSADARDIKLNTVDYTLLNAQTIDPVKVPRIDKFYTYRVTEVKQLTQ